MQNLNLELFNCDDNYLCKFNLQDNINGASSNDFTTIIILDISGSMHNSIDTLTKPFLPELFSKFNYKESQPITFITFSNESKITSYYFKEIVSGIKIVADGGTYMQLALQNLKNFLENNKNKKIRILSISDSDLFDQEDTVVYSNEIVNIIKSKDLLVNSQAIRFFTSNYQPDTRGISSCLQFSNVTNPKLIDISAENYKYSN